METQDQAGSGQTKAKRPLPTAEEVRALLDYDPATGIFRWRKATARRVRVGDVAGTKKSDGYLVIGVNCGYYPAHRLVFLYVCGTWPTGQVDHVDGNRLNNRIANLREVSHSANQHNVAKRKRPTSSKYLGVHWATKPGGWVAQICRDGKKHYLGLFATQELAYGAYLRAKAVFHPTQPVPRASAYDKHPEHTQ